MIGGFAESTIEATVWIIAFEPNRLVEWLGQHPPGERLERIARNRIAERERLRSNGQVVERED